MKAVVVLLLAVLAVVNAQTFIRYAVDDFSVGAGEHDLSFRLDNAVNPASPVTRFNTFTQGGCTGLLGCSRDMIMTVFSANAGRSFRSTIFPASTDVGVFEGEWDISTPKGSPTETILQYDGADNSADLTLGGLGSIDLTDNGLGRALRFSIVSDLVVIYRVVLYSNDGGVCQADVVSDEIYGTDYSIADTIVDIDLGDLDGDCDLSDVGAIELSLEGEDALDAIMRTFELIGLDDPVEPSPSPTPTPNPSASRPPSPSATPSPATGFTWYTFDDDDNGRSPCADEPDRRTYWVSDDNIIYYYFFGGNQRDLVVNNDSASSASALVAGISFIVALLI